MADQTDVENALVLAVSAALYPDGTDQPSVPGPDCRIYRGWPNSIALDADLGAGKINVTVFPGTGESRTTTRYSQQWRGAPVTPTLTASVVGASVTFGGTADLGQVAGILVDGLTYAYRTQEGDTPALVAANLAALARANSIVRLSGSTVTIAGVYNLVARVVADTPAQKEVRRQERIFRISCWCPTPSTRDATAAAIDSYLSGVPFLSLDDGSSARLLYYDTTAFDQSQNARLYRRDLSYISEYPTISASSCPAMLFGDLALNSTHFAA